MNAYKNASYVGFVLYFFSIILILYGLVNLGIEMELDEQGVITTGKVYELEVVEPYRLAWVIFKTEDGQEVRFMDKLYWAQDFEKYKVGQKVEVIYNPENPGKSATINDFFQRNTAPWWPVIVGIIVFTIGFVMRKIMLTKAKEWKGIGA